MNKKHINYSSYLEGHLRDLFDTKQHRLLPLPSNQTVTCNLYISTDKSPTKRTLKIKKKNTDKTNTIRRWKRERGRGRKARLYFSLSLIMVTQKTMFMVNNH